MKKPENKLTDKQRIAASMAAKVALATPLTEFMDGVEARLNEYDKRDEALVTPRKTKHS